MSKNKIPGGRQLDDAPGSGSDPERSLPALFVVAAESDRDEATAQDPDATTVAEEHLDDVRWLAGFPIREKLLDSRAFDREALMWRHTWPEVERMIRRIEARRPEEVANGAPPHRKYARRLAEVIRFPHPDKLYICTYCNGTGRRPICNRKGRRSIRNRTGRRSRKKQKCGMCGGRGFGFVNWEWMYQVTVGGRQQQAPRSRHYDLHVIASEDGPRTPDRCE
jgi:hypothetical protein